VCSPLLSSITPSAYSPEWPADLLNAILVLKHLRALHSPPPLILVSGSLLAEAEEDALANGAFAFIRKPFDLANLTGSCDWLLRAEKAFDDVAQSSKLWIHAAQRGLSPIDRVGVSQTSH